MITTCAICESRHVLLEAIRNYERLLTYRRNRGELLTAQMERIVEARRLISNHKHHPEAASA